MTKIINEYKIRIEIYEMKKEELFIEKRNARKDGNQHELDMASLEIKGLNDLIQLCTQFIRDIEDRI